jgi:hypothetical protein
MLLLDGLPKRKRSLRASGIPRARSVTRSEHGPTVPIGFGTADDRAGGGGLSPTQKKRQRMRWPGISFGPFEVDNAETSNRLGSARPHQGPGPTHPGRSQGAISGMATSRPDHPRSATPQMSHLTKTHEGLSGPAVGLHNQTASGLTLIVTQSSRPGRLIPSSDGY